VLTRDRNLLLEECLRGLLAQTRPVERIVVLDNASSDDVAAHVRAAGLLEDERVDLHRSEVNTGGAGGFAAAIELALQGSSDWLWLMDDDAEPRPDALAHMLDAAPAADPGTAVLCSTVLQPDGRPEILHRGYLGRFMRALPAEDYRDGQHLTLGFASFVGFMVRTDVARRVGLPRAEFFIGCDDVDYSIRAREHGTIRLIPESVIVHKLGMGGGVESGRSRFFNRVLGLGYTSPSWAGYWKNLYAIRNFVWIKHRYGRVTPLSFAALTATYIVKSLMYDQQPLRRVPWIARYAWRGRRGDFRAHSPQQWKAMTEGKRG